MTPEFQRDYAYYTAKLAAQQAEQDAFDAEFGIPRTDLAYAKAMERAQQRAMPRSEDMLRSFRESVTRRNYARAIGL